MKKIFMPLIFIILAFGIAEAQTGKGVGLGVIIGEPTGLSFKTWLSPTKAIDAAAAWSFSENPSFQFHMDYLIHSFFLTGQSQSQGAIPVDFGLGFRVKLRDDDNSGRLNADKSMVGVRIPFGVSYLFGSAPFDIFGEIVPVLDLVPDTHFNINGAVGFRFYFR